MAFQWVFLANLIGPAGDAAALARFAALEAVRFQGSSPTTDAVGGIVDSARKETWLTHDAAGLPTRGARKAIGVTKIGSGVVAGGFLDSENRQTELVHDAAGRVPQNVLGAWTRRLTPPSSATRTVWGHSLANGTTGGALPWTPMLETKLGRPVINRGSGGAWSKHVAAMQGGKHAKATVTGGSIPASGPVNIFIDTNFMFGNVGPTHAVTIAGIPGTMTLVAANGDGADCTFTRTAAGAVTAAPDGSPLVMAIGENARQDIVYLWALRNDFHKPGITIADGIENLARMVHRVEAVTKKILIFEEPPTTGETTGTADRTTVDQWNAAARQAFPQYWVPVMTWLRTPAAATAAAITFTAQDNTDIANGITPASFRVDSIHLSTAGNTAVAHRAYLEELHRGWI